GVIYIQAKRWDNTVGRPEIQRFAGALQGKRAKRGVFITTGTFSKDAIEYAENIDTRIALVDGQMLAVLMFEHGLGVSPVASYEVKKIDSDYFAEA
ncbi:MAG: restriction endonuclease, partial [Planctomycetaceae bacterium]